MRVFHTRKHALTTGTLVDLSQIEAIRHYWKFPFACTADVWRMIESAQATPGTGEASICSDISVAAQQAVYKAKPSNIIRFEVNVAGRTQALELRFVQGDDGTPVLTLLFQKQN